MGDSPLLTSEELVKGIVQKSRQILVLGVDARKNQGALRPDPAFVFCQAPFLLTFAAGEIPHAGSRHSCNLVLDREYINLVRNQNQTC